MSHRTHRPLLQAPRHGASIAPSPTPTRHDAASARACRQQQQPAARGRLTASPPREAAPWLRLWLGPEPDPSARPRVRFQIAHDAMIGWLMALGVVVLHCCSAPPEPQKPNSIPLWHRYARWHKAPSFSSPRLVLSRVSRLPSPSLPSPPWSPPPFRFAASGVLRAGTDLRLSLLSLSCYEKRKLSPSLKF